MKALILVDLQHDFMPDGALPVRDAYTVVPVANRMQAKFEMIVATQDWHPGDHGSFASNHAGKKPGDVVTLEGLDQILWPDHCVQGTAGAAFVPALDQRRLVDLEHGVAAWLSTGPATPRSRARVNRSGFSGGSTTAAHDQDGGAAHRGGHW